MFMSIVCLVLVASVQANPVPEADAKVIVLVEEYPLD